MAVLFVNAVLRRIIMSDAIIMIITFIFCCCCVDITIIAMAWIMAWIDKNGAPWVYLKKLRTRPCYLCKYGQTVVERRDFSGRKCMCPKYISYHERITGEKSNGIYINEVRGTNLCEFDAEK